MCQPLGTLESCCQSLWLLSHGSGGDTLGRVRLPQMSQRLPGRMGGQRGGGGGIWGFCSQCWGWSTAALAPTLHLWLGFLSPKMWRMLIRILTQLQGAYASSDFRSWVTKQKQTDAMILFFTVWSILVLNEQPFFCSFKSNGLHNEDQISSFSRQWISIPKPLDSQLYLGTMGKARSL